MILETLRVSGRVIASGVEQGASSAQPGAHRACASRPAPPRPTAAADSSAGFSGVDSLERAGAVQPQSAGEAGGEVDSGHSGEEVKVEE